MDELLKRIDGIDEALARAEDDAQRWELMQHRKELQSMLEDLAKDKV